MDICCSICLVSLTSESEASILQCGHLFHTNCIDKCEICAICKGPKASKISVNFNSRGLTNDDIQNERRETEEKEEMHQWLYENNPKAQNEETLLHWAAEEGHEYICKNILANVVPENEKIPKDEDECTPLHFAAKNGHTRIFKKIKETFEIINPENKSGRTPLHEAAKNGHTEICAYILGFVNVKNPEDNYGCTPYDLAAEGGHHAICQMMTSFLGFTPRRRRPKLNQAGEGLG